MKYMNLISEQHEQYSSKNLYVQHTKNMLENNFSDHSIYYVTITFMSVVNQPKYEDYREYFEHFRRKFNILTKIDGSSPFISKGIFFPEISYEKAPRGMCRPLHFHGHIMVHHMNMLRFYRKCVVSSYTDADTGFHYIELNKNLFDLPEPKLKVCSVKASELRTLEGFEKTSSYDGKQVLRSHFTEDMIILI